MTTLNLNKGDLLNLTKENPTLTAMNLGLGWDASTNGRAWDLDAFAIMVDEEGKRLDTVSFRSLVSFDRSVKLNGDNLTGNGDGDDEVISVNLEAVNPKVVKIGFFVNIYSAGSRDFAGVKNAFIRMVDAKTKKEVCIHKLSENGKGYNALHFANLVKANGEWKFEAISRLTNGSIQTIENEFTSGTATKPTATTQNRPAQTETAQPEKKGFFSKLFGR